MQVVKLSKDIESEHIDWQENIRIYIQLSELKELILALCLLHQDLTSNILLLGPRGSKFNISKTQKQKHRAKFANPSENPKTKADLPQPSIDALLNYYLIYYRDSFADVGHIDIETECGAYITFFSADSKPP